MREATYLPRACFEQLRGERGFESAIDGLWAVGDPGALARPTVAIVGTRSATPYGRHCAVQFARELGAVGCCVISGLALGIDAAAHAGALEASAPTIGVLGSGHERFFPKRNSALADRIVACGGAVLSPYAPEVTAQPYFFLARNGIVAALADAVLVIEAPTRSGALNTAQWAAPRIPVLAVPGDIDRRHVAGCHALIRDGAILARSADDVLEVLGFARLSVPTAAQLPFADDPVAARILDALADGERDLDAIVASAAMEPARALAALMQLEIDGRVERSAPNRFVRR